MLSSSTSGGYLIEDEIWAEEIKEAFKPYLQADFPYMKWVSDAFPTGDTLTIPTTGRIAVRAYVEGDEVTLEDPSTNEIQLTIDTYNQAGFYVTDKLKQDSYIIDDAVLRWKADVNRKHLEKIQADVFNVIATDATNGHTAADDNDIGGIDHRWAASGTSNIFSYNDFAHAAYVFDKGNVPAEGRVFIVDPKVKHDLSLVTATNSNEWFRQDVYGSNAILAAGLGYDYLGVHHGFQVYCSNLLSTMDTETVPKYGTTTTSALTAPTVNLALGQEAFFGAFRQIVEVESWRDPERKRDVHHATVRYGLRVYRPESVIAVLSV